MSGTPIQEAITIRADSKAHEPQQVFGIELTVFHFVGDACHFITSTAHIPKQLRFPHESVQILSAKTGEPRTVTINIPHDSIIDLIVIAVTPEQVDETPCRCPCKTQRLGLPKLHTIDFAHNATMGNVEFTEVDKVRCARLLSFIKDLEGSWHVKETEGAAPQLLKVAEQLGINLLT